MIVSGEILTEVRFGLCANDNHPDMPQLKMYRTAIRNVRMIQ